MGTEAIPKTEEKLTKLNGAIAGVVNLPSQKWSKSREARRRPCEYAHRTREHQKHVYWRNGRAGFRFLPCFEELLENASRNVRR